MACEASCEAGDPSPQPSAVCVAAVEEAAVTPPQADGDAWAHEFSSKKDHELVTALRSRLHALRQTPLETSKAREDDVVSLKCRLNEQRQEGILLMERLWAHCVRQGLVPDDVHPVSDCARGDTTKQWSSWHQFVQKLSRHDLKDLRAPDSVSNLDSEPDRSPGTSTVSSSLTPSPTLSPEFYPRSLPFSSSSLSSRTLLGRHGRGVSLKNLRDDNDARMGQKVADLNVRVAKCKELEANNAMLRRDVQILESRLIEQEKQRMSLQMQLQKAQRALAASAAKDSRKECMPRTREQPLLAFPSELLNDLGVALRKIDPVAEDDVDELMCTLTSTTSLRHLARSSFDDSLEARVEEVRRRCTTAWRTPASQEFGASVDRAGKDAYLRVSRGGKRFRLVTTEGAAPLVVYGDGSLVQLEVVFLSIALQNTTSCLSKRRRSHVTWADGEDQKRDVQVAFEEISSPALPSNDGMRPPTCGMQPRTDGMSPSTDDMRPCADGLRTLTDGQRPPTDGIRSPTDSQEPPTEGVRPSPSTDGVRPPIEEVPPPTEGVQPSTDGERPPTEGVRPSTDGVRPPTDGMQPPTDGMSPSTDDLRPSTDGVRPPTEGVRPSTDGMRMSWFANTPSVYDSVCESEPFADEADDQAPADDCDVRHSLSPEVKEPPVYSDSSVDVASAVLCEDGADAMPSAQISEQTGLNLGLCQEECRPDNQSITPTMSESLDIEPASFPEFPAAPRSDVIVTPADRGLAVVSHDVLSEQRASSHVGGGTLSRSAPSLSAPSLVQNTPFVRSPAGASRSSRGSGPVSGAAPVTVSTSQPCRQSSATGSASPRFRPSPGHMQPAAPVGVMTLSSCRHMSVPVQLGQVVTSSRR